ncbi:MAG: hypothetical protein J7641_22350 [Cyanobacteria bacterium SID2]|nr:hypothetical protein [Cyanobacteria bacterium SID2]MBP0004475.1 hypothetical protein [Cyanobacteria bacterium SBC]
MSARKVFPVTPQNNSQAVELGYFINELFWNLLFHPQWERVCKARSKRMFYSSSER